MKRILLLNGEWTLVSDEDYIWAVGFNWCPTNSGYAQTSIDGKNYYLHRLIAERMSLDCSNQIDHINSDKKTIKGII